MNMCPIPNCFRDRAIECTTAKLLIRRRYYVYVLFLIPVFIAQVTELVQGYNTCFQNSTVNINALCNSCEDMACCSSECVFKFLYADDNIQFVNAQFVSCIHFFFCTLHSSSNPINKNLTRLSLEILVAS